jgi:hypothetical protein
MFISFFHHSGDNSPAQSEITWEQLAQGLADVRSADCTLDTCKRSECPHKDGPAWSAARYAPGTKRSVSNVLDVHALVLDFDHVNPDDLPGLLDRISPYKCIITSSHSDRLLDRCLRVVIATDKPVPAKHWYRFWGAVITMLGLPADKQVKDPSRLYYLPSRSKDACGPETDGTGFAYGSSDGLSLDVDAILATVPEPVVEVLSEDFEIPTFNGAPSQQALSDAAVALAGAWPEKGRNTAQLALCGALARAGWPVDLIADFVEAVCEIAHPGNGDRPKRLKAARASVTKIQNGEFVAGWPTVEEYVDPETVQSVINTLGLGSPKFDQSFVDAMRRVVHDNPGAVVTSLVTVSHEDIQTTLQAARRRLSRSSSAKKLKEGKLIGRALDGKPFAEHPDDDQDQALVAALQAITRYAPRGSSNIMLAEYLTKSRPDIPVDTLCEMVDRARNSNTDDDRAELPPDDFEMDPRTGKPVNGSQHNFDIALRRMNVTFHFDAFARKKIIEKAVGDSLYRETVTDRHIIQLMFEIERDFKFSPPKDKFYDYCGYRAHLSEFHPVLDYLDGLESWDGVSRTDSWLIDFGGAPDTPYVRAVSRLVLVAAVRRVRSPGCKFDEMLILESPQGSYKSTAIKSLCPNGDWFSDNFGLEGDSKKMIEQTSGKWIVEAGELNGISKKDHNSLKQYLSSTHDEARMSYARETQRLPRQFIIIGTTNDTQYLRDHTGDRRFWPVRVNIFNVAALLAIRDQLWAEANYLEAANPSADYTRLDPSLYGAAAIEQSERKVDNAVKIRLEELFGDLTGRIKVSDTWRLLGDDPVTPHNLVIQTSNAMHEMGWSRVRGGSKKVYYYARGTKEEQQRLLHVTGSFNFGNLAVKPLVLDANGEPVVEPLLKTPSN